MFYSGLPVTQEALNEVAEVSGVMTFGEDFLPAAVRFSSVNRRWKTGRILSVVPSETFACCQVPLSTFAR